MKNFKNSCPTNLFHFYGYIYICDNLNSFLGDISLEWIIFTTKWLSKSIFSNFKKMENERETSGNPLGKPGKQRKRVLSGNGHKKCGLQRCEAVNGFQSCLITNGSVIFKFSGSEIWFGNNTVMGLELRTDEHLFTKT